MKAKDLINELIKITHDNMNAVQEFLQLPTDQLNLKQTPESWSILECIEHLNRYGRFYLPEIERQLAQSGWEKSDEFKPGILGNYFAKSMLPKEKLNKMKTFQSMNPANSDLDTSVLEVFIQQQEQMLKLLSKAREMNLTKIKTAISISKWIKLRLGDTLRVVIYHNLRHIVQAKKILKTES